MKPIYFPFTYVPEWVAQALAACFQRFIVYQPSGKKVPGEMQPWVDVNLMEVRVPGQTDDQAIEKVVKDFRSFASLHDDSKNLKTAALLGQQYAIPFFSETSASRIVSDLKKDGSSDSAEAGSDPLFCARVFLDFAQDFDRQRDELNQGLGVHDQRSYELMENLKGEKEIDSASILLAAGSKLDDPAEYMTMSRLQAYAWPGNVRELRNLMERLVLMTPGPKIRAEDLPQDLGEREQREDLEGVTLEAARKDFEREFLIARLTENDWNISRTAEGIGIARESLSRKVRSLEIKVPRD